MSTCLQTGIPNLKVVEDFNCDIQEFITVQDPPAPQSDILHLHPLTSLHLVTEHIMELPWKYNIISTSNARILEELALHTPLKIHVTNEQDLNPRFYTVNDHPSVLTHEMMVIEPGENPTHILSFKSRCSHSSLTNKPSTMSLSTI